MKRIRASALGALALLASACGGGGGGGPSNVQPPPSQQPPPPSLPPAPSVSLNVTTSPIEEQLAEGDEFPFSIAGTWAGSNVAVADVYLVLRDREARFVLPAAVNGASGSDFRFEIRSAPTLAPGQYSGAIELIACKQPTCDTPYENATANIAYTLSVAAVEDWSTHQRDAGHRGYVPIWLDASRFAFAWNWAREQDGEPIGGINAVVASHEKVFITKDVYHGQGILYALHEADGKEAWRASLNQVPALGPPAVYGNTVFAPVTGHEATFLWAFDAQTGVFRHKSPFAGQWPNVMAPTAYADRVYVGAGYYGGITYSFTTDQGLPVWEHSSGGIWDMFTPAVDDRYVYHHNGSQMFFVNPENGATVHAIADPFGSGSFAYHAAPMLGSRDNVIAYAGDAFSGRASSNAEHYEQRVLSSFNIADADYEWSTSYDYLTAPAVANGVIYVARNNPMTLHALDEATGQVLWEWRPTQDVDSSSFHRNIVVTRNLLFVSTDQAVHALDIQQRASVWRYPRPGMLAISATRTLYIATGARESDGGLVAITLR